MTWLQRYLGTILTAVALLLGGAIGYGRIQQICTQVERKADREDVTRELDQIHQQLERMEKKLDVALLREK